MTEWPRVVGRSRIEFVTKNNIYAQKRTRLLSLRNRIERYLIRLQTTVAFRLSKIPQFVLSDKMLDAKIKQLKKGNVQNATKTLFIELDDLGLPFLD